MEQRINMIMRGARDLAGLRRFYEQGLGWTVWQDPSAVAVMYKVGTSVLVFLDAEYLAKESGVPIGPSGVAMAVFVGSKARVDEVYAQALAAGAVATSPVRDRDLGLYSGYFTDPEGNPWEVVWSPHMPLDAEGALTLG